MRSQWDWRHEFKVLGEGTRKSVKSRPNSPDSETYTGYLKLSTNYIKDCGRVCQIWSDSG